jgi:hypothetical protein
MEISDGKHNHWEGLGQCTIIIVLSVLSNKPVRCALCAVRCVLCAVFPQCLTCSAVCCALCAVCCALCAVCCVLCAVFPQCLTCRAVWSSRSRNSMSLGSTPSASTRSMGGSRSVTQSHSHTVTQCHMTMHYTRGMPVLKHGCAEACEVFFPTILQSSERNED